MKILVVGIGNPILSDDGVGTHVVQAVEAACTQDNVAFTETSVGGLRLLSVISGYERVILVDAIMTPDGRPGDIYRLAANAMYTSLHADCSHDMSLPTALALGRKLAMPLPHDEHFIIIAVEVEDVTTFGESCTPAVAAAIPRAVDKVFAELEA